MYFCYGNDDLSSGGITRNVYDRRSEKVLQGDEENAVEKPTKIYTKTESQWLYLHQFYILAGCSWLLT